MGKDANLRRTHRALTGMLWASVLLSVATLPADRFPAPWLLALRGCPRLPRVLLGRGRMITCGLVQRRR